jgi:uncharacterized integral membrane protein
MKQLKYILAIIIMLIVVILVVQNHEAMSTSVSFKVDFIAFHLKSPSLSLYHIVTIAFHLKSPSLSLYHIVTIAFLFGVIIAGVYGIIEGFRLKRELRTLKNASQDKDRELNSLRNLPITAEDVSSSQTDGIREVEKGEE